MKYIYLTVLMLAAPLAGHAAASLERETDFNFGWKFHLQADTNRNTRFPPLNDSDWRNVRLPHDWSVEHSFSKELEGCTGYLPGGIGWYQKHFQTPENSEKKRTLVLFDGVYNNAVFWLNGKRLGENPYGYSPVHFDLTEFLNAAGTDNVLTVFVDHSRYADSRWYTGSGIYRNVKLITVNELHIPIWGTYLTTPEISKEQASVKLETNVVNTGKRKSVFTLSTCLVDAAGLVVAEQKNQLKLGKNKEQTFEQTFAVMQPKLWSPDSPSLYKAVTTIEQDGKKVDEYTTTFGIRSLKFVADEGFYLNGKLTNIKGACLHHDGGLVGTAVPKGVWRRRLAELKAGGCNAIRFSHNPFSEEFLDLCDEMGFLVQNEFFDEWDYAKDKRQNYHDRHDDYITRGYVEHFQEWAQSDLERTMLRDRNHPSIFQWSLGNEIEWTYLHYRYVTGFWEDPDDPQNAGKFWGSTPKFSPEELRQRYDASPKGKFIMADTAKKLAEWTRALDTSRPVTQNLIIPQISHVSGVTDVLDIAGYSYRGVNFGWAQKHFPNKPVTCNEDGGSWDDWRHVIERPGVFSIYMWTAIAYMGESNEKWPQKSWYGDMLNLAGFKNQGWNHFKSIWVNEPHISIGTLPLADSKFKAAPFGGPPVAKNSTAFRWGASNMHWNYKPGEMVLVEVCSNHSMVELFLNGRSLGSRSMSENEDRLFRWAVPFEAGTLTAKAGFEGAEVSAEWVTASEPTAFTLTTDKTELKADGYDVAHLVVQLVDKDGIPVKTENREITFKLKGDARMLGVDTGAQTNVQDFQSDHIVTDKGRCLLIVQSNRKANNIVITARAEGLGSQSTAIKVH
ncbi:glycoside hydrolase family 2 TIM barrel-domain containing protein [Pontiellaceae bacterium B12227]|nr:glycoside hydrolase family 2 TIM barrel-domain containing protein [Pontiellaceae bacterium B12227]